MTREIFCHKLQKNAAGLNRKPYPGELGQRIYDEISQDAWDEWLAHQTMLINERRLNPLDPEARTFLEQEMENFLFNSSSDKPPGYTPPLQE